MKNTLLFALLGAVYIAVDGHFFTYDDDQPASYDGKYFSPSYVVSKTPPGLGRSHYHQRHYPSYYISRTLPRWPNRPHGHGPVYTYPEPHGRSIYRTGRTKKKYQGKPIVGGWWYKMTKKGLISGRWGAPPPPGLEKEHYIYGGGAGWGWGGSGYGSGGHGSHGPWGGHPPFAKDIHGPIKHSHHGHKKFGGGYGGGGHGHGGYGDGGYGGGGYGGGGGWGWPSRGWGW